MGLQKGLSEDESADRKVAKTFLSGGYLRPLEFSIGYKRFIQDQKEVAPKVINKSSWLL